MRLENECMPSEFSNFEDSPEYIYLHTKFPDPSKSSAFGSGIYYSIVMKREVFFVRVADFYENWFDIYHTTTDGGLHLNVDPENFVYVRLDIFTE